MKLILSDRHFNVSEIQAKSSEFIDLSKMKIENCVGCFSCWTKTPGKCIIRDDAVKIYPLIAASEKVMFISRVKYGSYDSIMKMMLERTLPTQQAFIRLLDGETHHVQRNVVLKQAVIIGYGDISVEEKNIFNRLIERNAKNMNFESYRIIYSTEDKLLETVKREVAEWES